MKSENVNGNLTVYEKCLEEFYGHGDDFYIRRS
jgi:hypothetical protein